MSKLRDVATAVSMLVRAMQESGLNPPTAIVVDRETWLRMRRMTEAAGIAIEVGPREHKAKLAGIPILEDRGL